MVALPFASWRSVRREIRGREAELLLVSGQSARDILTGKWRAQTYGSGLIVISLFPYFLLRYFLGEVEVAEELVRFAGMVVGGAALAAYAAALSPYSWTEQLGLFLVALVVFPGWLFVCGALAFSSQAILPVPTKFLLISVPLFVIPTAYLALGVGAARLGQT